MKICMITEKNQQLIFNPDTHLQNSVEVMVRAYQLFSLGLEDRTGDQQVEVFTWKMSPEDLRKKTRCYKMRCQDAAQTILTVDFKIVAHNILKKKMWDSVS